MSRVFDCSTQMWRERGINAAAEAVESGKLVVLPTDTLYGLGVDAFNPQAVNQLLAAKHRGPDMPVPVLVGSWQTAEGLVLSMPAMGKTLIQAFWPGGLSLIVQQAPSLPWNLGDTRGTVMLRMPLHPIALDLLQRTGPMAVSSANVSGQAPATTVAEAQDQLGQDVYVYLDGGRCEIGQPSTIVDITGPMPVILREGAITRDRIAAALALDPAQIAMPVA